MCSMSGHLGKLLSHLLFFTSFVTTSILCNDKRRVLSWQIYACRDKTFCHNKQFLVTNMCCDKHNFVMTKLLSRQAYFLSQQQKTFWSWQNFSMTNDPCGSSRQWYYSSEICCKLVPLVCFSVCTLCVFQWSSASAGLTAADSHKESGHSRGLEGECVV